MQNTIESAVIPSLLLKVDGREYIVEFPLSAIIRAESKTDKPLKSLQDWLNLQAADVPSILEAGLSKHHPEVTAEELTAICDQLNPEALDEVLYALCALAFPRRMAALEARAQKGTASPNG